MCCTTVLYFTYEIKTVAVVDTENNIVPYARSRRRSLQPYGAELIDLSTGAYHIDENGLTSLVPSF